MPMTNYPQGFAHGLSLRGMPLLQTHPGEVFWVSNSTVLMTGQAAGSDGNPGTFQRPFATIAGALNHCLANRGDIVFVKPGHAETLTAATSLLFDVAGVAIIGLGTGSKRPTLTYTTANTATIGLESANMSIQNFLFVGNFAAIAAAMTVTATGTPTDFCVENCEFRDTATNKGFQVVVKCGAYANALDGLQFLGNRIISLQTAAAATNAVSVGAAQARLIINDNYVNSTASSTGPALLAAGANVVSNIQIARNRVYKPTTAATGILMATSTTATGLVHDNYAFTLATGSGLAVTASTGLGFAQNFVTITGAAEKSAIINPVYA